MFIQKDNQYSVECMAKVASDCTRHGEYCDSEEEARDWVELECWIFSGEGWICTRCNEYFMATLKRKRKVEGMDGHDDDLHVGIDTVR